MCQSDKDHPCEAWNQARMNSVDSKKEHEICSAGSESKPSMEPPYSCIESQPLSRLMILFL